MKFPAHILLDINKPIISLSSEYWIFKYLYLFQKNIIFFYNLTMHRRFLFRKDNLLLNKLMKDQKKFTIRYNLSNSALFLSEEQKLFYKNAFQPRLKVKHRDLESKHFTKEIFEFLTNPDLVYDEKTLKRLYKYFVFKKKNSNFKTNILWTLFDINFLKKERMYTKLKYSRVPQYDIVSGGSALLLGGFLGFLICEKFGFELIDSGDFYFLFIYVVFLCFSCRLFFKITTIETTAWNAFSLKWLIYFCQIVFTLIIKFFKNIWNFK